MEPSAPPAPGAGRVDYVGAVYGSLLAASVVVGTSPRKEPLAVATLEVLLIATGIVFWLAHVYARLAGEREQGIPLNWAEVRSVGRREWPLAQAAFPPAAAAAACWAIGLPDVAAAWAALLTALTAQVAWSVVAAVRAGATAPLMAVSAAVNLVLGLIIVALKTLLAH